MADGYEATYQRWLRDPENFWAEAAEAVHWYRKWDKVLDASRPPFYRWFTDALVNTCYNALDVHCENGRAKQTALIYDSPVTETIKSYTYQELLDEVSRFAGVLSSQGIQKGDRVVIYMPMVPETLIAMLACARIGAIHSVVFGGFSSAELAKRINDACPRLVISASCGIEINRVIPYKPLLDQAIEIASWKPQACIILQRPQECASMVANRDLDWSELMTTAQPADCVPLLATDPLYILYTSGTTGIPKGVVRDNGGHLVALKWTMQNIYGVQPGETFWAASDLGWAVGHSYIVYGPLFNGNTTVLYEGKPVGTPDPGAFWRVISQHKVTTMFTAPTAIRAFLKWGDQWPSKHDLSSLRLLGTVGEPINPEAWMWYREVIGQNRCPIVDTWWQTETGAIMITPIPGATTTKPGSATQPFPGIDADIMTRDGKPVDANQGGYLVIKRPWPSMLRTIWGDDERYKQQYWSQIEGIYFAGDGARRDKDGYFWIMGRIDDVINVSGHRLGTAEIESALVSHSAVAEAAVVARPDDLKGSSIVAFVTLEGSHSPSDALNQELRAHVVKEIGALARPDDLRFADMLPKTRSGKIMRRLLREIATSGSVAGDVTTLEDFSVLEKLRAEEE